MKLIDKGGWYAAENATVVGDVRVGEGVSIWFGAVVRGDMAPIRIGKYTNIQDLCVLHCDPGEDLEIGDYVTVGHQALIHGRKIASRCLIGMQSVILAGAEIGEGSIIGAGAVVREGQKIPPHSIVVGVPGKVIGQTKESELQALEVRAQKYHETALRHVRGEIVTL